MLFAAFCFLPTAFCSSEIILIVVIVKRFFLDEVQFYRIEADEFQVYSTLFTINYVAFVRIKIHVDVGIAFRTGSGRHFFYLH